MQQKKIKEKYLTRQNLIYPEALVADAALAGSEERK